MHAGDRSAFAPDSTIIHDSIEFHFQVLTDDIRELHVLVWFSWSLCIRLAIICLTGLMGSRWKVQIYQTRCRSYLPDSVY